MGASIQLETKKKEVRNQKESFNIYSCGNLIDEIKKCFFYFVHFLLVVLGFCLFVIPPRHYFFFNQEFSRTKLYLKYGPPRYPFGRAETRDPVSGQNEFAHSTLLGQERKKCGENRPIAAALPKRKERQQPKLIHSSSRRNIISAITVEKSIITIQQVVPYIHTP